MSDETQINSTQDKINVFHKKCQSLKGMGGEKQIFKQHELKN